MLINGKHVDIHDPELDRLQGKKPQRRPFDYDGHLPVFDKNYCTGCCVCLRSCPTEAITKQGLFCQVDEALCKHCGKCIYFCPFGGVR